MTAHISIVVSVVLTATSCTSPRALAWILRKPPWRALRAIIQRALRVQGHHARYTDTLYIWRTFMACLANMRHTRRQSNRPRHRGPIRRAWYVHATQNRTAHVCRTRTSSAWKQQFILYMATRHIQEAYTTGNYAKFDTDSVRIAVDNCASRCITNCKEDFIPGTVENNTTNVQGIGSQQSTCKGTVRWSIADDTGATHTFNITEVLYMNVPFRLLSPQHWAQNQAPGSARCITTDAHVILTWKHQAHVKTVPLSKYTNVGLLTSTPGYQNYKAYTALTSATPVSPCCCFPATTPSSHTYVTDDEEGHDSTEEPQEASIPNDATTNTSHIDDRTNTSHIDDSDAHVNGDNQLNSTGNLIDFDSTNHPQAQTHPERPLSDAQAELLRWHYRLGHASFDKLRLMASEGTIPKRLQHCPVPQCPACTYGKMTKRPWRTKAKPAKVRPVPVREPGDCVSVDQMESPTPGLLGQLKGFLTRKRYTYATIFVDQYSGLSYVHLQTAIDSIETVEAKKAFEKYSCHRGVEIKHYHADNGRFADNLYLADVARSGQTISYCGVNAHFQNGIAERRIRELQDQTRTMLLDAKSKWPSAITVHLWPFALRYANHCFNHVPT